MLPNEVVGTEVRIKVLPLRSLLSVHYYYCYTACFTSVALHKRTNDSSINTFDYNYYQNISRLTD